jgi:hypothetical protein
MAKKTRTLQADPWPFHPFNVQDDCGIMWGAKAAAGWVNEYDITTWDPNVDQITFTSEAFYNREDVKKILHAPMNVTWHGCQVGEGRRRLLQGGGGDDARARPSARRLYMDNDRPLSVVPYIAEILEADIPFLVYNGDRDMTTNMVGQELTLNNMEWSGKEGWADAPRGLWMVDNYEAGWAKEYKNLGFVVVYNSGHMVPYNQPGPAFDLVTRLLRRTSFVDKELPQIRVKLLATETTEFDLASSFLTAAALPDAPAFLVRGKSSAGWEQSLMIVVSFLAGVMFTLLFTRRGPYRGYERVPNATI